MSVYGDETWRLAAARDAAALTAAADLLDGYDAARARAFALALAGREAEALAELRPSAAGDWPFAAARALDAARVHHLAGNDKGVLAELRAALAVADRPDPAVAELARAVAARTPALRRRALAVVLTTGGLRQRLRNGAAVLRGS